MFVDMFDVLVSSHSVSGGSTGQPMDTFSLNFAKIEYDYKKQDAKGGVGGTNKKGWDFKKHTAS